MFTIASSLKCSRLLRAVVAAGAAVAVAGPASAAPASASPAGAPAAVKSDRCGERVERVTCKKKPSIKRLQRGAKRVPAGALGTKMTVVIGGGQYTGTVAYDVELGCRTTTWHGWLVAVCSTERKNLRGDVIYTDHNVWYSNGRTWVFWYPART